MTTKFFEEGCTSDIEPNHGSTERLPVVLPGSPCTEADAVKERESLLQLECAFILAMRRQSAMVHSALRSAGLTRRWAQTLRLINEHEGSITGAQIAQVAGIDAASVTRLIDRLEGKGLVARVVAADDRRRQYVERGTAAKAALPHLRGDSPQSNAHLSFPSPSSA
ncbi:MarR family winged helix-turn-helix transcriptional regulator [Variovorax ginsengisoli]|uniref:MarR family transcriptional regulator n=1 Tax=Variovorax ginsengisoli TaxID=363844 RepID=A0ABT8SGD5_9BURK|nr:MarR family transcriptional regulator [Variovorax ginsengisoli]MDN8618815.1 MarR family transcriptional regulator [Variovorax ginsengisoli]MDO1537985.1 MarR family transcriptional regulator [Variovorax ginsengisoli]